MHEVCPYPPLRSERLEGMNEMVLALGVVLMCMASALFGAWWVQRQMEEEE